MLGQKRLLLGIEITLFGLLVVGILAVSNDAWPIGAAIGLLGLPARAPGRDSGNADPAERVSATLPVAR